MKRFRFATSGVLLLLVALACPARQAPTSQSPGTTQQPATTATAPTPPFAELIRKTVGFMQVNYSNGSEQAGVIGTCFFVFVPDKRLGGDRGFIYLVTNRHVAQPGIDLGTPYQGLAVFIRLNLLPTDGGGQSVWEQILLGGHVQWHFPTDPAIDLAVLPLAPDQKKYDYASIPMSVIVSAEQLKTGDVGVSDPVTFAGYFANFPGRDRIEPIVREGVIAMMPQEKLDTTLHKPGQIYLADLHAFHGNSGSPVFVNIGGMHRSRIYSGDRYVLLGILSGYYPESEGFSVPAAMVLTGKVRDNSGISTIVPGEELVNLLNSPEVQADRDSQVATLPKQP
jgi:hypothetical protein